MGSCTLVTTHYHDKNRGRREELELCLKVNASVFDEVVVLSERADRPDWFVGRWFVCEHRPRYRDALEVMGSRRSSVWVMANSDILFTQRDLGLIDDNLKEGQVYCLTRWDQTPRRGIELWNVEYSQDSWAMRELPNADGFDYVFGVPGCDNRFAADMQDAGWVPLNPSKDVRTYHMHASRLRTKTNAAAHRVPEPYLYIQPHSLTELPRYSRPKKRVRGPSQYGPK